MRHCLIAFRLITFALASALLAGPVVAREGGEGQGRGQDRQREQAERRRDKEHKRSDRESRRAARPEVEEVAVGGYFSDRHRSEAREYYSQRYSKAKSCPPGLARKGNGCMPPGQSRKLVPGQPVPAGVTLYPVPRPVLVQLPPPPYGYRYARVGNDIVLVRNETQLIVDIIVGLLHP